MAPPGSGIDQDTLPEPMPDEKVTNIHSSGLPPADDEAGHQEAEVDFPEGKNEEELNETPQNGSDEGAKEDVLDILKPKKETRVWKVGNPPAEREYVQRPLSFIAKMQWFALVGDVLDKSMSGENALTISNLMSVPGGRGGSLTMEDFRDADTFVQAVGKLIAVAPDFLIKSYCIWLAVPDYERDLAADLMAQPAEEGGLSDDDGLEIIEVFIDQNYEALDSFFRDKLGRLQQRVEKRMEEARKASQR
jgi:hypothetical protein